MIAGGILIFLGWLVLGIPEIAGILSPELEDTFSEWAWDLHGAWVATLSGLSLILGAVMIWFSIHLWEGWVERRKRESRDD
jgi:hypothetical protein